MKNCGPVTHRPNALGVESPNAPRVVLCQWSAGSNGYLTVYADSTRRQRPQISAIGKCEVNGTDLPKWWNCAAANHCCTSGDRTVLAEPCGNGAAGGRTAAACLGALGLPTCQSRTVASAPACGPSRALVCWVLTLFRGIRARGRAKRSAASKKKPQRCETLRVP